jgi:hypothetical protein
MLLAFPLNYSASNEQKAVETQDEAIHMAQPLKSWVHGNVCLLGDSVGRLWPSSKIHSHFGCTGPCYISSASFRGGTSHRRRLPTRNPSWAQINPTRESQSSVEYLVSRSRPNAKCAPLPMVTVTTSVSNLKVSIRQGSLTAYTRSVMPSSITGTGVSVFDIYPRGINAGTYISLAWTTTLDGDLAEAVSRLEASQRSRAYL